MMLPVSHAVADFPLALQGKWDTADLPCPESGAVSDSAFIILANSIRGYEDTADLRLIEQASNQPLAWRVLAISNIAPDEVQGRYIYVLAGDRLTISDGASSTQYQRCHEDKEEHHE